MSKKNNPPAKTFKFIKHANIGAADAADDSKYLTECFVDTGELDILKDQNDNRCIIMGRTGSGKTALLQMLQSNCERVINISPDDLALSYLSNNEVIKTFTEVGVNMDLFYRLLWRHVFTVEILKAHFNIINEEARDNFLIQLKEKLFKKNKMKQDAMNYLTDWGEKFWLETEYRVKEVTQKLEQNFKKAAGSSLGLGIANIGNTAGSLNAESSKSLSDETRYEIARIGQKVVSEVQINKLSGVMGTLDDLLEDKQKQYYITIDKLDQNWVSNNLRHYLIRALLETISEFNKKVSSVKIIAAVREDLIDRVFRYTRSGDDGYQEEKYQSMYLNLNWTREDLEEILDRRVNQLIKEQYTKGQIKLSDLLPFRVESKQPLDYILIRTMMRPRDAIMFFNECIKSAEGKAKIAQQDILDAEGNYSLKRLRALADEWASDYETLIEACEFLKKQNSHFRISDIDQENFQDFMLNFMIYRNKDEIYHLIEARDHTNQINELIIDLLKILYRVGIVGFKMNSYSGVTWSYEEKKINTQDINDTILIYIHPAFWRILGVRPV